MIDVYAASRQWKKDGAWIIAPAGLPWIKEGAYLKLLGNHVTLGDGVTLGDKCSGATT